MIGIIKHISEQIYASSEKWEDYLYLGKKDAEGRIFGKSDVKDRDYLYLGLDDKKGNYFYIRHKDDELISYGDADRKDSCSNMKRATASCRLVAVMHDYPDKYNLNSVLVGELSNVDFSTYTGYETKIEIEVTGSLINPFTVIEEESNGKKKAFSHTLTLIAIDFNLGFDELYDCQNLDCGSVNYHGGSL